MFFSRNFKISLFALSMLGSVAFARTNKNDLVVTTYSNNGSSTKSTWFATAAGIAAATHAFTGCQTWRDRIFPALVMSIMYGWEWAVHGVSDSHKNNILAIIAGLAVGHGAGLTARCGTTNVLHYAHIIAP